MKNFNCRRKRPERIMYMLVEHSFSFINNNEGEKLAIEQIILIF